MHVAAGNSRFRLDYLTKVSMNIKYEMNMNMNKMANFSFG